MTPTVVRDYETVHAPDHVEAATIIRTHSDVYPSGWNYSRHYGEIGGQTLLRYDNAHERKVTNATCKTAWRLSTSPGWRGSFGASSTK